MHKFTGIVCFLLAAAFTAAAQLSETDFEKYNTASGLTGNDVRTLLQDSRGFLWVGTTNGLNRFDGRTVKQYNSIGAKGLTDLTITGIAEDADGNIWIGTQYGLNKLNPFTDTVTRYYEGSSPGTIPYRWCNTLYTDSEKNIWLGTEKGLALYNKNSNSFTNYTVPLFGKDPKANRFINAIFEDSKKRLWLATSFGIKLFNRKDKTFQSYHFAETDKPNLRENVVLTLFEDETHNLVAGTWGGGLLRFNAAANRFDKAGESSSYLLNEQVNSIAQLQTAGNAIQLLATGKGLLAANTNTAEIKPDVLFENATFQKIIPDNNKNTWLAGSNGLYKLPANSTAFKWLEFSSKVPSTVFHIIPAAPFNAASFYLTTTNGWWKLDAAAQTIRPFALPPTGAKQLQYINDWLTDENGFWFTSIEGFGYYNSQTNTVTDYSHIAAQLSGQIKTGYITKDNQGKIWATMRRSGLLVYDPATKQVTHLFGKPLQPDNMFGKNILDLKKGQDGFIYFTAVNKLFKVNSANFSYTSFTSPPTETAIDTSKIMPDRILFTPGNRILVSSRMRIYELKNERLVTIFPKTGFSDFVIEKIFTGSNNSYWAITGSGVMKTDSSFKKWSIIKKDAGGATDGFISELYTAIPGQVLFTGVNRIGILNEKLLQKNSMPAAVIITRFKYGDKERYFVSLQQTNTVNVFFKDDVEIELSAETFLNTEENKLLYLLDGWDNSWRELKNVSFVRYGQLPPGQYTFRAKTVTAEGAESAETVLRFVVQPPFYRTWWFIAALVLLAGTVLFLVYRYKIRKALELEKMRTRIASDLHDDIGATLSSISMYSEAIKKQVKEKLPHLEPVLDKMGENSRDMVTGMSDIVWAINPDNDIGGKLLQRMENYATDICAAKEIKLQFTADEKLQQLQLAPEQRKNIYLIFKEAVNNAVKYAGAKNVQVKLQLLQKHLSVTIADDGCGFDFSTIQKGNGLNNMQLRAAELKGQLNVQATPDGGTSITLTVTV